MTDILKKLKGGDRRSIGRANEVVREVEQTPSLFKALFNGLYDCDPVVRMRSADVIEKVTRNNSALLSGVTSKVISILVSAEQQEICWHMAQVAPRLTCSSTQEKEIIQGLKGYLSHQSRIVRVSAMEALVDFSEKNMAIRKEITAIVNNQIKTGSPAVQARGRKLLARLKNR